ncbi:uncharacterized protein LOC111830462 [Capsella rubella]|uniref:uncharacterized protein LOC111830462 n=1 Tax=Capsella rubella TaxID=81985 RepID=UPI000CD50B38|nr:uncharacterized protein LOC111830462 [Capsella rubella]
MSASFAFLREVKPYKTSWKIQVRVLHTWKTYSTKFGETFEMVLADIEGTKIHASVKKELINRFQNKISQGEWRSIENFGLGMAGGQFKPTNHRFKMSFMTQTIVSRMDQLSKDPFLNLTPFDSVPTLNLNYLIDVLGQIVNVGEIDTIDVNNRPTKKIEFELRDENDSRLSCTLWGTFADQVYHACEEHGVDIVICLIRFAKIKTYKGKCFLLQTL